MSSQYRDVQLRTVRKEPIWSMTRAPVRRCPGCYLPMRYSFACDWFSCDWFSCEHCGQRGVVTGEWLEDRPRWRRRLDRLMGMDS